MKPLIILTTPRSGASTVVAHARNLWETSQRYANVPQEIREHTTIGFLNKQLRENKIFATKMHVERFITSDYDLTQELIDWIGNMQGDINFAIMRRQNRRAQLLSYCKSQSMKVWDRNSGLPVIDRITVPRIAVEKFFLEQKFAEAFFRQISDDIPGLEFERLLSKDESQMRLFKRLTLCKESDIDDSNRYNKTIEADFANIKQIDVWIEELDR